MAGHSKFADIKHKSKSRRSKGKIFTKLGKRNCSGCKEGGQILRTMQGFVMQLQKQIKQHA